MPVTSAAKLASHIWRGAAQSAANAAHNSANTFRGAFQGASAGSSSSTSSSASGWAAGLSSGGSSAGAGAGGAKFHAGRGAHFTYQQSGRAISQAASSTNNDPNSKGNDDEEEARRQKAYKLHLKSQSRSERSAIHPSGNGNLTNSQMQVRFRHAFASKQGPLLISAADSAPVENAPAHSRHASTVSAVDAAASDTIDVQTVKSEQPLSSDNTNTGPSENLYQQLKQASKRKDVASVRSGIDALKALPRAQQSTANYNMILESLYSIRHAGQPIREITDAYVDMVKTGLSPNSRTFTILVKALTLRDVETHDSNVSASAAAATDAVASSKVDEDLFGQALELLRVAHSSNVWFSESTAYNGLLRSCALRGDVDRALSVLDLMERHAYVNTDARTFLHLINTFVNDPNLKPDETQAMQNSRKLVACQQVFDEFLTATQRPGWTNDMDHQVWNALINAHFALGDPSGAVKLFQKMLEGGERVPPVRPMFISAMIKGFLANDDAATALHWFTKVAPAQDESSVLPLPDCATIEKLIAAVATSDQHLEALQHVFRVYLAQTVKSYVSPKLDSLAQVISAHLRSAQSLSESGSAEEADAALDRALDSVSAFFTPAVTRIYSQDPYAEAEQTKVGVTGLVALSRELLQRGRVIDAGSALTYVGIFVENMDLTVEPFAALSDDLLKLGRQFFATDGFEPTASPELQLFACAEYVAPMFKSADLLDETFASGLAQLYRSARATSSDNIIKLPLSESAWSMILDAFCFEEQNLRQLNLQAFKDDGFAIVLRDLDQLPAADNAAATKDGTVDRPAIDVRAAVQIAVARYGEEVLVSLPSWAVESYKATSSPAVDRAEASETASQTESASTLDVSTPATTPPQRHSPLHRQDLPQAPTFGSRVLPEFPPVEVIDTDFGQTLAALGHPSGQYEAPRIYENVVEEMRIGNFAPPEAITVLMCAFGRLGNLERVEELYAMSQHVLHALVGDPAWQSKAWFVVEDGMIQALSHAGRPEAATVHRHRIIAAGGTPTSTAYAALIATIRDTTDDAQIAQELFDESQRFGVRPTAYLFNTVISKLSRARKADRALQLFDEMMNNYNLKPTTITYGAVINACTRIGDEEKAVELFERMEKDPAFKPRVPPYNTMMQFYVQSNPNREKALFYYRKMRKARVAPSAHTYKLLLDLYGAVEPVQPDEMMKVFQELSSKTSVTVQGTHWASLINCYGCLLKDLDRAISTFESIATHPSSRSRPSGSPLPDAVAFEALLAVFVAHHRIDLIRPHLEKMQAAGIKMTAYVANLLIRGYSMEGPDGLEEARALFESMNEPAAGVAAAGNHPPRAHGAGATSAPDTSFSAQAPVTTWTHRNQSAFNSVQREPSTYEAMIRAELAHGNRDRALALVDRMEARAFPPALVIRVRSMVIGESAAADSQVEDATAGARNVTDGFAVDSAPFTFGRTSPSIRHGQLADSQMTAAAGRAYSTYTGSRMRGVRYASTMTGTSGTSNPPPGPPKPNSPFTIFDRAVKTMQKDRAALRPSMVMDSHGQLSFDQASTRGTPSRQTDYVRRVIAESLADRVLDIKRDFPTIVELGAGPGFLRHYLDSKGTGTKKIIMCDTSEALLNRDRHLDREFDVECERRVLDEEMLPFEEASLDCVVVSGGLHWTNDLPGVLIQIRRALKPDGVLIAGLCGGDTLFELRTSLQLAEQEREGGISARISPMADTRDMASLLSRAGFTIPTVDVDEVTIGYPSMYEVMHDLRDMGESNAVINRRGHLRRDTMLAAGAIYQAMHGMPKEEGEAAIAEGAPQDAEGVPATFSLIFLIGWSPSPTQPKPLARGSAKSSLKDVLAGEEGDVQKQAESSLEAEKRAKEEQERKELEKMMSSMQSFDDGKSSSSSSKKNKS